MGNSKPFRGLKQYHVLWAWLFIHSKMELITKISSITTTQNYIALRLYLLPSYCLKIGPSIIEIRLRLHRRFEILGENAKK